MIEVPRPFNGFIEFIIRECQPAPRATVGGSWIDTDPIIRRENRLQKIARLPLGFSQPGAVGIGVVAGVCAGYHP
jgi:hypothetical protein